MQISSEKRCLHQWEPENGISFRPKSDISERQTERQQEKETERHTKRQTERQKTEIYAYAGTNLKARKIFFYQVKKFAL